MRNPSLITGHTVIRLLISSYFVALGLQLIPGTTPAVLLSAIMPASLATFVSGALVVSLAACVMVGFQRRAAALLLGILMFWASYTSMLAVPPTQDIGTFWRDMALIGALLLTYSDDATAISEEDSAVFRHTNNPESHALEGNDLLGSAKSAPRDAQKRTAPRRPKSKLYREDLELVRAS